MKDGERDMVTSFSVVCAAVNARTRARTITNGQTYCGVGSALRQVRGHVRAL